jgi:hypothetical protein
METSNKLMKKSRLSEVSKLVEDQGLKELRQPPFIIEVRKTRGITQALTQTTKP